MLAACVLALVGGFAGAVNPVGDSLGVFRLQFAAATVVLALALAVMVPRQRRLAALLLAATLALATPAALSYRSSLGAAPAAALTIYQKNLNYRAGDLERIADDILAVDADIVTLQEVNERNRALLERLRPSYPHQAHCPFSSVGGTAVLSRLPAAGEAPACAWVRGITALRIAAPGGPVWAVSLHLYWPWPHGQAVQSRRLQTVLEALDGPVIVGGDFNMVPWGASVAEIARAARAEVVGPTVITFRRLGPLAPLPIDHVLLPEGWEGTKELRPELGSDHSGILVRTRTP
jgi:endonuclease/exonuclease/phosphatase (EEP) superfamily protein YafD